VKSLIARVASILIVATTLVLPALLPPSAALAAPASSTAMSSAAQGFFVPYARVIAGDTLEIWHRHGNRGVRLIGIDAPNGNTSCGLQAAARLDGLASGGLQLSGDRKLDWTRAGLHWYYAHTPAGVSVPLKMVRSGYAWARPRGVERDRLARAQANAKAAGRGCLWDGDDSDLVPMADPSASGAAFLREPTPTATTTVSRGATSSLQAAASTAGLPSGFSEEAVAANLNLPTNFAFLPDGRTLIALKGGIVLLLANGVVSSTPVIDISTEVNDYWDRGLIGMAVDPNFTTNGYIYLYYTYENNANDFEGTKTARMTRVTMSGNTASRASETTLVGTQVGSSCFNFPVGADCIPTDSPGHSTGSVAFAPDGTIFMTVGDGSSWGPANDNAMRAQNMDWLAGKVLHVTRTGQGMSSNPYYDGNVNSNRSKIWALGVRNAYRMSVRASTGLPVLGDVGWNTWEETDVVTRGANLGWPCYEANSKSNYQTYAVCQTLYSQVAAGTANIVYPFAAWRHDQVSSAATGGVFYTGNVYPAAYQGAYFYGDYAQGWLRYVTLNANNTVSSGPTDFHTAAGAPVAIQQGPDGNLYYISIYPGELRVICYNTSCGSITPPPPPPSSYSEAVLADAPAGYWRLGESSGTTAADDSGHGRDGTYVGPVLGQPGLLTGDADTSAQFDGSNDYVQIPDAPVWNLTGDLTVEALINVTGGANYRTIVAKQDASTGVSTFEFRMSDTGHLQFVQSTTGGTFMTASSATVLSAGTHHVAVTKSATTVRLYIDGALDKTVSFKSAVASNTKPVRIGYRDGSKAFGGRIDEVAIYPTALGSARISTHDAAAFDSGPTATITSPASSLTYKVGDVINYSGSAVDSNGNPIASGSLSWDIRLHHCYFEGDCHIHPYLQSTGASGSFTVPDHGDDIYFELILTATDSNGKTGSSSVSIFPKTVNLTLATSPPGLTVFYDGVTATSPLTFPSMIGSTHSIDVPSPQGSYTFSSWSDGGAQNHLIVTPSTAATYTATFTTGSSSTYSQTVLTDAPLGYWRLGESSGTTAADSTGNGRNGTYVGPVLGQAGLLSGDADTSAGFDGVNDYVQIADAPIWNLTGDLTIEALINVTGGANYRTIVAKHDANGDASTFELRVADTGKLQFVQKTTAATYLNANSATVLSAGTHYVAVTKSGSSVRLYIDGVLNKTVTFNGTIVSNAKPVRIGYRDGSKAFGGRIDEVAIYGVALSAARIAAHAQAA
jgi:glucose/arabinose dehydrogenase/endonuclease YncB( thermonuclease family)